MSWQTIDDPGHVIVLCGGVGGAKLASGLAKALPPEAVTFVVNTGDDFCHLGLQISPDIDSVVYALAGLADRERGWGIAGESWNFMEALHRLGGETWFRLGDRDLAMHVERSRRLANGETLSFVTSDLAKASGVRHRVLPMTDFPVRTIVQTNAGELAFQHYFVAEQCRPVATGIRFEGAMGATPTQELVAAFARRNIRAVIVCPSNPYLSIDPILAVRGMRDALKALNVPIVAVSPIVAGQAIKGPAAKLMSELGARPDVTAIAEHYEGFIDGLIIDERDSAYGPDLRVATRVAPTLMNSDEDKVRLAEEALEFAASLSAFQ